MRKLLKVPEQARYTAGFTPRPALALNRSAPAADGRARRSPSSDSSPDLALRRVAIWNQSISSFVDSLNIDQCHLFEGWGHVK